MNEKQIEALKRLCERQNVEFDEKNFPKAGGLSGLPEGYVVGWAGSIYVGCSPEGHISS